MEIKGKVLEKFQAKSKLFSLPDYSSAKDIFSKFSYLYLLYELSPALSKGIDFLSNICSTQISTLTTKNKNLSLILNYPEVKNSLLALLFNYFLSSNAFGIVSTKVIKLNNKTYKVPVISPLRTDGARLLGSTSALRLALYCQDSHIKELLQRYLKEGIKVKKEIEELLGDVSYIERAAKGEDLLPLSKELRSDARSKLSSLFIIKEENAFIFKKPTGERYGKPVLFELFKLVDFENTIVLSELLYYSTASFFLFLLTTGTETDDKSIIEAQIKNYIETIQENIEQSGILGADFSTKMNVISGRQFEPSDTPIKFLGFLEDALFKNAIGLRQEVSIAELSSYLYLILAPFRDLVYKYILLLSEKTPEIEPEIPSYPPIVLTASDVSKILRFRDRGESSRSTAIKAIGLNPEAERATRKDELSSGFEEDLIPAYVPYEGRLKADEAGDEDAE